MSKFVIERGLGQIVDIWRRVMRHGHATAPLSVNAVAMSHVGKIRQQNEDYFLIVDLTASTWTRPAGVEHRIPTMGALLVVADGMGGAEAGEVASAMPRIRSSRVSSSGGGIKSGEPPRTCESVCSGRWRARTARSTPMPTPALG